jgi:hypothetical protein
LSIDEILSDDVCTSLESTVLSTRLRLRFLFFFRWKTDSPPLILVFRLLDDTDEASGDAAAA